MPKRLIATIHFNTDRYDSRHRTGAFDSAEFAKLLQDFDSYQKCPTKTPTPSYYVIYSLDNPAESMELRLFFDEVERIDQSE